MSILSQMVLIEKHGLRVDLEALASILDTSAANLRRRISEGTMTIPTYVDGGKRWADTRDVADYFDTMRQTARDACPQASNLRTA